MNLTDAEKHRIFYQAAANIEARPELYHFWRAFVGDSSCPACMWGHVGRVAGMGKTNSNIDVCRAMGFTDIPASFFSETDVLYQFGERGNCQPNAAAAKLRAFADHHWPQPEKPEPSAMSFGDLMQSLKEARV